MIKIKVDGKEVEVPEHFTLLQAAETAGVEIPRFCFHEKLSIAGNCRMCLVEVKGGAPKPQASCALGVKDLRPGPNGEVPEILTDSPMVKKAREGVLEFMLINHPLDCPICDQGGECDLQDQAMAYGRVDSRYREPKRSIQDKYLGPLIKTNMTRCIHCTRCVRFTTEVAGISQLGLISRGEDAEITSYLELALVSELQGNVIDLCPVGALTSKPYEFRARPWELGKVETIDVMDAMGSSIRVDHRGNEILRILPVINEDINSEWISDKTRFIADGLRANRIDRPYIRVDGVLKEASWEQAFEEIKKSIDDAKANNKGIGAIAGDFSSVEEMFILKDLMEKLGSKSIDCRPESLGINKIAPREAYLFNSTINGVSKADAILLIGTNPRVEAPVLNAFISMNQKKNGTPIATIGDELDLQYATICLGKDTEAINDLATDKCSFKEKMVKAKYPLVIIGEAALSGTKGEQALNNILSFCKEINALREDWVGFSFLPTRASFVGGMEIGFVPEENKTGKQIVDESDVLFLLGSDNRDYSTKKAFTVYIGTHGDNAANCADVILPSSTYVEKSAIYLNMEGRPQKTNKVVFGPGESKEDWQILNELAMFLGFDFGYNSLEDVRAVIFSKYPHLSRLNEIKKPNIENLLGFFGAVSSLPKENMSFPIKDFYLSNSIARSSKVMAECSRFYNSLKNNPADSSMNLR